MLSEDKVIALFCIVDDLIKAMHHKKDIRVRVSDSDVITTAFVTNLYFRGHFDIARMFMKIKGFLPLMLDKSKYCRQLYRYYYLLVSMFFQIGSKLKAIAGAASYVLDSFPSTVCDNMFISRCHILRGNEWKSRHASMHRYFYGVKVQVLTLDSIPVEFFIVASKENESRALNRKDFEVVPVSCIYTDSGYTNYELEDLIYEMAGVGIRVA